MDPRELGGVLYLLSFLLVLGPISELLVMTVPMQPSVAMWRFASIGLLGERIVLPTVGLFTAMLAATLLEHRAVRTTLAALGLLLAAVLTMLAVAIALDGVQLRHTVRAYVLWGFDRSLLRSVLVLLWGAVVAGMLGVAALKGGRMSRSHASRPLPTLLVGPFAQRVDR